MAEKIRIVEWNLHGNGGRGGKIPYDIVKMEIQRINPDIIVFTEFDFSKFNKDALWQNRPSKEWPNDIENKWPEDAKGLYRCLADKGYKLFITDLNGLRFQNHIWKSAWNGIGIAVKQKYNPQYYFGCEYDYRRVDNKYLGEVKPISELKCIPDYLALKCTVSNIELIVVGVRVKTVLPIKKRYEPLLQMLQMIKHDKIVVVGDFNNGENENFIEKNCGWRLYTPELMIKDGRLEKEGVYSHCHPRYGTMNKIDHLLTNFNAKVNREDKEQLRYDWDYGKTNIVKLDHAILVAEIEI